MNQEEMAVKLTEVDARSKSNTHRINELAGQIDAVNRLATAVEVMATEQKHQTTAMAEIKADVAKLDKNAKGEVESLIAMENYVRKQLGII